MNSIKERFPTIVEVKKAISKNWGDLTDEITNTLEPLRVEVHRYRDRALIATGFAIVLLIVGDIYTFPGAAGVLHAVLLLISVAIILNSGYRWYTKRKEYAYRLNRTLFPYILNLFALEGNYADVLSEEWESQKQSVLAALGVSELLTEKVDDRVVDDIVTATFKEYSLTAAELHATRTEGSGKHRRTVEVFKGVFVSHELPADFSGVTFISTEGDEHGYGHRDFWSKVTGKTQVAETELEWNDFERKLHVATTDGAEARYILTPDFMQNLYAWWKEKTTNVRVVFRENHIYILFPDRKVSIGNATTSTNTHHLQEYALSFMRPMWHVLLLLEDVRGRFR